MRKLSFGVANSLDNRIARPDDSADWLLWSDEVSEFMKTFFENVDTILMGRKTYEVSKAMGGGPEQPGVSTYVFSRTIKDEPGVQVVSEDAAEFVRDLKQQEGKDICCMGGGELACALLEADLIDEILLNVHPLLWVRVRRCFSNYRVRSISSLLIATGWSTTACRSRTASNAKLVPGRPRSKSPAERSQGEHSRSTGGFGPAFYSTW